MTTQTEDLIKKFVNSRDSSLLPAIIIGMQEEDNVSGVISFKNCFKFLRNIAAHEPATIIANLDTGDNVSNTKLVFIKQEDKDIVVLDIVQLSVWMMDMFLRTNNIAYIAFCKAFLLMQFPNTFARVYDKPVFQFGEFKNPLSEYNNWKRIMYQYYGDLKTINDTDPYIIDMWKKNQKVFWRMAIPSMVDMLRFFFTGGVDIKLRCNINAFVKFYTLRE